MNTDFLYISHNRMFIRCISHGILCGFTFNVCRHVKSNAIVISKDSSIIGIGSGQPSRLDSCKIAIEKMNKFQNINENDEVVAASDAFFPFVDGIETLVQSGISAVIQPVSYTHLTLPTNREV